ncbi:MAG TPA: OmpH family outer membrane protein [Verrucomicrobiota bacterium]|jgi:Skp family chaperone for outer membrane proteins|nr:MAG: Outer membrane protein (OmpH-like) [Verrucomicrobia bacterium ADurb.Bin118]HPY31489.1 OmpH family outer membrane protein [Verrucomicrobiota bacterium]HQB17778.1 OmpH family outer membrane protein [Verrucomicrobiota bacterium]
MNKCFQRLLLVALLLFAVGGEAFAQGRIATVDLRKLFDGYWKTKQADAALKDRAAELERDHKAMVEDWKKGREDYQNLLGSANDPAVSAEERDKRKRDAETRLKDLKEMEENIGQFERQARTTLDEQRARMRGKLLEEIKQILNQRARAGGFSLVLDVAADSVAGTPVVLYTNNENDLTDALLEQLNATAPAEFGRAPGSAAASREDEKKK